MSLQYAAVKWNRNKRLYDLLIALGVAVYLAAFYVVTKATWTGASGLSDEVIFLRGLGTCGFVMLHLVLCIGPLARLDARFLPVLYNRRHLGVATFLVGLSHAALSVGYYHGFGRLHPLVSLLTSNTNYGSWQGFPFEILGLMGLIVLFVLAATSHDFWQKTLGASIWKSLHMSVYVAYGLLLVHVVLGGLRSEASLVYLMLAITGVTTVAGLQLATGWRERRRERPCRDQTEHDHANGLTPRGDVAGAEWIDVGSVDEIRNHRAKVVCLPGRERVAVFRHDGKISAVTNVCAHQRGPLGEGKIVDGCISCPWHGWEYRPETGQSPPPFQERIATYRVRVVARRILLCPHPLPPGTPVKPATFEESIDEPTSCCA